VSPHEKLTSNPISPEIHKIKFHRAGLPGIYDGSIRIPLSEMRWSPKFQSRPPITNASTQTMMANTPPTEGKRATALRQILSRSLEKTLQTCSYEKVSQSLPTLATKTPDQLRYALDQALTFLKTQVEVCFREGG
jgi:hypothetical protein